jgi:hypothetical protein
LIGVKDARLELYSVGYSAIREPLWEILWRSC